MESAVSSVPSLLELVEPARWQRLQDHFARVFGIPLRTVSPSHELLVNPSWPLGIDVERVISAFRVGEELDQLIPSGAPPDDIRSIVTPVGVTYSAVPIPSGFERPLAYFVAGPMIVGPREDERRFRQRLSAMGADPKPLWPLLLSLKPFSFVSVNHALYLIADVGSSMVQLAAQSRRLSGWTGPELAEDDPVVARHADEMLRALLQAAMSSTGAEGGCVMMVDQPSRTFRIKASEGLSEAVLSKARPGKTEGVAGWALAHADILLLDDETIRGVPPELAKSMGRPGIVSSLVAPLRPEGSREAVGVLCLRTSNRKQPFTPRHAELLRRLLDLTYLVGYQTRPPVPSA
jgi:hypothetical protein